MSKSICSAHRSECSAACAASRSHGPLFPTPVTDSVLLHKLLNVNNRSNVLYHPLDIGIQHSGGSLFSGKFSSSPVFAMCLTNLVRFLRNTSIFATDERGMFFTTSVFLFLESIDLFFHRVRYVLLASICSANFHDLIFSPFPVGAP